MAYRKKNYLLELILTPPAWLFLLMAIFFYAYMNTQQLTGQVLAFPVALVFLLVSLSRLLVTEQMFAATGVPVFIQARLFQGISNKKQANSKLADKKQTGSGGDEVSERKDDAVQEQYQEALEKLQRKRDEKAAAVLEKIGSSTLESAECEHILRAEKKEPEKEENNSSSVTMELDALKALSDERFEATVAAYYNCKGYHAEVSNVAGALELVLKKKEMSKSADIVKPSCIVHIRAGKSGNAESRFVRVLHDKRLKGRVKSALLISRSTFTKGAVEFAESYKILLLDPRRFAKAVNELPEEQIEKIKAVAFKK